MSSRAPMGEDDLSADLPAAVDSAGLDEGRALVALLGKAFRAVLLYDEQNPTYRRFIEAFARGFRALWDTGLLEFSLRVEEDRLLWGEFEVYREESRGDSLAFLLYRDGILAVTFLPGFEREELEQFLRILGRVRRAGTGPDALDLVTLLWEAELEHIRYGWQDVPPDTGIRAMPDPGIELPPGSFGGIRTSHVPVAGEGPGEPSEGADGVPGGPADSRSAPSSGSGGWAHLDELFRGGIESMIHPGSDRTASDAGRIGADFVPTRLSADPGGTPGRIGATEVAVGRAEFNPTPIGLDPSEMTWLAGELEREMSRSLQADVLAALLDRIEEPRIPERQTEILGILGALVPRLLFSGEIRVAGQILADVRACLGRSGIFDEERASAARDFLASASSSDAIRELTRALSDRTVNPSEVDLRHFLDQLGPEALGPLLEAAEGTRDPGVRSVLLEAGEGIASAQPGLLVSFIEGSSAGTASAAARMAGRLGLEEAAAALGRLLRHDVPEVRIAAIQAMSGMQGSVVGTRLVPLLADPVREVRLAALAAVQKLRVPAAAAELRTRILGRGIRAADLTEKIAVFEAYGSLRPPEAEDVLGGLLHRRGLLGREPPEIRACAALGLGRIRSEEALRHLERAAGETDPVVRSAVNRVLRADWEEA